MFRTERHRADPRDDLSRFLISRSGLEVIGFFLQIIKLEI